MKRVTGAAIAALILTGGLSMAAQDGFDHDSWVAVAGDADRSAERLDMVEAAIAEIPVGTPQDEVLAKLGEPDEKVDQGWAWLVGGTLFGGEYRALLVSFDDQGRVAAAQEVSTETWQ